MLHNLLTGLFILITIALIGVGVMLLYVDGKWGFGLFCICMSGGMIIITSERILTQP